MSVEALDVESARRVIVAIRRAAPVVHCLTNEVTAGHVADALAAVGASPVMASAPEEVAEVVAAADSLVLNLGTPSEGRWSAIASAAAAAAARGLPIALDPVGCGLTAWRTARSRDVLRRWPIRVVRGNAPEVAALVGIPPGSGRLRGVTATGDDGAAIERIAREASVALRGVTVLVTGSVDVISDGSRVVRHSTADGWVHDLVGAGDVLTALVGACLAVEPHAFTAAAAALSTFAAAARDAGLTARGPGSFWPLFIDALAAAERA